MESDSIMDISALSLNLNSDGPDDMCLGGNFSLNVSKTTSWIDILNETIKGIPSLKSIQEKRQKRIRVAEEKLKGFDEDFHGIERKIDDKTKELTSAMEKLNTVEEEVKNLQTSIQNAQKEEKYSSKEIEELINQQSSAENENATEKFRIDLYRQMTGVHFSYKPENPTELRGYASCRGPLRGMKTFQFNTEENSAAFIGDYIWNVLEEMHEKNWEGVGSPATNSS